MGHISEERSRSMHGIFETVAGCDQSMFSPELNVSPEERSMPPFLAMNDFYCDLVRSGVITLSKGRLESLEGNTAIFSPDNDKIDDIAAVVIASGFDPASTLDYLPAPDLETLQMSRKHPNLPIALAFHGTHHPKVPGLGFVGYYRGPYWGVMQMQAQFLAKLWSDASPSEALLSALKDDNSIQRTLDLRDDPRMSQFPTDYVFQMQKFASALSIDPFWSSPEKLPKLSHNDMPLELLIPSNLSGNHPSNEVRECARTLVEDMHRTTINSFTTPQFVSWAVFRSLLGTWKLERDLRSALPSYPSGRFSGTARFLIREKTADGLKCAPDDMGSSSIDQGGLEYLYIEEGDFRADNGMVFQASRRYIWRYDDRKDKISVWFAKPEEPKRADYLFHEIEFTQPETRENGWPAKAGHLCIDDFYDVKYNFAFNAVNLDRWSIEYAVKGPKKDYTIHGVYTR